MHAVGWLLLPCRASGRLAETQQENTEATDADLLRKANPFLAKLLAVHLAGDKTAVGIAGVLWGSRWLWTECWCQAHQAGHESKVVV